jgi:hypothetical protein
MDDIQREGVESGSEPIGGDDSPGVSGSNIQPERITLLDDEERGDAASSSGGPEDLESGSGVPDRRKLIKKRKTTRKKKKKATVSESEEVGVRSMIEARVRLISPTSGRTYFFPKAGSEVKVASEDVNWLLSKRQISGACCGPEMSNLAFELVQED